MVGASPPSYRNQPFLSGINKTLINLIYILIGVVVIATGLAIWLVRKVIANPLAYIADDLSKIERLDVERISRRPFQIVRACKSFCRNRKYGRRSVRFSEICTHRSGAHAGCRGYQNPAGRGEMKQISVLFCDVTGFTGLSEKLGPRIVQLMEPFFSEASEAIAQNGGTIDKFMGDAVMAFWGAPRKDVDHAKNACRAALDLVAAVKAAGIRDDEGNPLRVRIGLNSGEALVGNIGSEQRLNYTAIGDVVNVASRLEGANKDYGTLILIGPETRLQAADAIVARELDTLTVSGRTEELVVYELISMADGFHGSLEWIKFYEQGLALYREGQFAGAVTAFEKADQARNGRSSLSRDDVPRPSVDGESAAKRLACGYEYQKAVVVQ